MKQRYGYSCGSAVVATLLTLYYEQPTAEEQNLRDMITHGDASRIRAQGFSMLDLEYYLDGRDLNADGFKLTLEKLAELGVPGIALLNVRGYRHFVVVKGIRTHDILLGDPSRGTLSVPRSTFEG